MSYFLVPPAIPEFPRKQVEKIIQELKSVREIPVQGFSLWKLTIKIFHCFRVGGRHGLATLLDESFVLGYWKQVSHSVN